MRTHSGYKTITPIQLANVLAALEAGTVTMHGLRVYFAAFALVAIREAASRDRRKRPGQKGDWCRYEKGEIERLTTLSPRELGSALRSLERVGLVAYSTDDVVIRKVPTPGSEALLADLAGRRSPKRPIPVPRALLRFLAQNRTAALTLVIIAYLIRGLSIGREGGEINPRGTVKASWIAETLGISERATKYAQASLRKVGWTTKDTQSNQRKLNRDGAYFIINVDWAPPGTAKPDSKTPSSGQPEAGEDSIVNRDKACGNPAPPGAQNAPNFAPPWKDLKTSIEQYKDQKARSTEPTGVCKKGGRSPSAAGPPTFKQVHTDDLRHFARLEALFEDAVGRGWVVASEAMALNFVAAAVRSREVALDPPRLFVSLVRRGLWQNITHSQEDRARRALARYREGDSTRFRPIPCGTPE